MRPEELNYFIYIVGEDIPSEKIFTGEIGVGFTSISPGICDCSHGTMYVAPNHIVPTPNPSEHMIRRAVLQYFGLPASYDY